MRETDVDASATKLQILMGMAGTAERSQNNEEAIAYYNRVLEADPTFSEAWLGKGRAAGWLSTLAKPRISETVVAFGHAIATASDESKLDVSVRASNDLTALVNAMYNIADRHHRDHAAVVDARTTYVSVTAGLIDALKDARSWHSRDRGNLESTVTLAHGLLNLGVNPELTAILKAQVEEAKVALVAMDPNYKMPALADTTVVQQEAAQANSDSLGVVVLIIVVIVGAFITAASR